MLFSIDAAEKQNRIALVEAETGQSWTYRELTENVERRRAEFGSREHGLFFLFCRNTLDSVAWYLAAIETGHAVALLNAGLDQSLKDSLISAYEPDWIGEPESQLREHRSGRPVHKDLRLLLSTSGSTGSPKFVRLTRTAVEANARSIAEALGIKSEDRPIAHLPLYYSYGLSVVNSHLLAGSTILLTGLGLVTAEFWTAIREHRVDSFSGVPYTYQMLRRLGLEKLNIPSLRTMTQAGGKLDDANTAFFSEAMRARGGGFWTMYGQTEATARITILPASELPGRLGSAGKAVPGGKLSILTADGEYTTAPDVEGELVYDGPNVMMGYAMERADLTKGDELGGRLHTGDRATLDAEEFVRILGRATRDAKVFGLRMNLDEIEAFIRTNGPAAAVAGTGNVIVFCEFGDAEQHVALRHELSTKLKVHHSAFEFRRIDRLPTRDTGKIAYERLRELL